MQKALSDLWPFAGEMFRDDDIDRAMHDVAIAPLPSTLQSIWKMQVHCTLQRAYLNPPKSDFSHSGGRLGFRHTEHLGHMLATMQFLQRAYPGATW